MLAGIFPSPPAPSPAAAGEGMRRSEPDHFVSRSGQRPYLPPGALGEGSHSFVMASKAAMIAWKRCSTIPRVSGWVTM